MHGYYGRTLIVDLSARSFHIEPLGAELLAETLGGKGLATRLLLSLNKPGIDPLEPENHLIFATGPFCQSSIWGGSRYGVFTKSPQTGFYSESYAGGRVPEAIDATGFDAIVIRGAADRPTVLTIHPEGCLFHDADDLWGADTYRTEDEVRKRFALDRDDYRKPGAVVIGPAAENGVRFAVIENDYWRSAGRTGVGTVMGAKRLKAVVFHGDRKREPADPEGLLAYTKAFAKEYIDHPGVKAYRNLGTTMMVTIMNQVQAFPARYWAQGTCDHWQKISGEVFHDRHEVKPHACAKCFMACGRMATLKEGPHQGLKIEGPEYETIYAFGGLCMIESIEEIAYLNDLCDRLGMDTITAGNLCALVMEATAQGRIDYSLSYGDAAATAQLLENIAYRRNLGEVLADGIIATAEAWGLGDLAVHVKGLEPAGYDPRVLKGMGLAYATSDRGACHLRTTFYKPELAGMIPPDTTEGKAQLLIDFEDRLTIFDSLILCRFYRDLYTWEELLKVIPLVTGTSLTEEQLRRIAAHTTDNTRRFNLREGLGRNHDRLPNRLHRQALPSGHQLKEEELEKMLSDYYRLRGWNEDGTLSE